MFLCIDWVPVSFRVHVCILSSCRTKHPKTSWYLIFLRLTLVFVFCHGLNEWTSGCVAVRPLRSSHLSENTQTVAFGDVFGPTKNLVSSSPRVLLRFISELMMTCWNFLLLVWTFLHKLSRGPVWSGLRPPLLSDEVQNWPGGRGEIFDLILSSSSWFTKNLTVWDEAWTQQMSRKTDRWIFAKES